MMNKPESDLLDIYLQAAAPYAGKTELLEYQNADPSLTLSRKAKKRILRHISQEQKPLKHTAVSVHRHISLRRAILVILLLITLSFAVVLSIHPVREPTWRESVWTEIPEKREHSIHYTYRSENKFARFPSKILDHKSPQAVGTDYVCQTWLQTTSQYCLKYTSGKNEILYLQSLLKPDKTNGIHLWVSSHSEIKKILISNTYTATMRTNIFENVAYTALLWTDGVYRYYLASNLPPDELLAIANSIK